MLKNSKVAYYFTAKLLSVLTVFLSGAAHSKVTEKIIPDINHPSKDDISDQIIPSKDTATAKNKTEQSLISLNFQNIDIRALLQLIADFRNLNLIVSDNVEGRVTLRLDNVPWEQALEIILEAHGLGKKIKRNIMTIAPLEEIKVREEQLLNAQKTSHAIAPIFSELLAINYADAAEIATLLKGGETNKILSERGSVQLIQRVNSLLVKDTEDTLKEIKKLIGKIDIPVSQVQIESRIVAVDEITSNSLGVKWGYSDTFPGAGINGLFTDFSIPGPNIKIGMSVDSVLLDLELSALEEDNRGEVISQPKVITMNKQKAVIKSGKEIAYQESASSGATSVAFKEAVLSLEVTPQITPDDRIIMDIRVKNDDTIATTQTQTGGNEEGESLQKVSDIPLISKNEVTTRVIAKNEQTIVLGGVFRINQNQSISKVPFLGDLAGIGQFFRRNIKLNSRSEVLVFITPKIIKETNMQLHSFRTNKLDK